jgi:hypothetical protein
MWLAAMKAVKNVESAENWCCKPLVSVEPAENWCCEQLHKALVKRSEHFFGMSCVQ